MNIFITSVSVFVGPREMMSAITDPSHWIFDFLIRVGWITPVPENKVREWQKRGYLAKYGPCCRYGRLTTAIGFPYLIDVGFS